MVKFVKCLILCQIFSLNFSIGRAARSMRLQHRQGGLMHVELKDCGFDLTAINTDI